VLQATYIAALVLAVASLFAGNNVYADTEIRRSIAPAESTNPLKELIQGAEFIPAQIRAQQADDFDNPAFSYVESGEILWGTPEGPAGKSCQTCHGGDQSPISIKRAAANYPKYFGESRQVISLSSRINICRKKNIGAAPWGEDSTEMVSLLAYLGSLGRGAPSAVDVEGLNAPVFEHGQKLFETKLGLLQLSCAQCHNNNYGQKFGGDIVSQGHPLSYPSFKVSENRVITLHERFQMCNRLVRAEPQQLNAPDYVALELYLSWRSKSLPITAPGVRP